MPTRFCYACGNHADGHCDYCGRDEEDHPQSEWKQEVTSDDVVLDRVIKLDDEEKIK